MSAYNESKTSNWWFILGFLLPPLGLIMFLVKKTSDHAAAVKAGIGALSMTVLLAFIGIIVMLYYINLDPIFFEVKGLLLK